MSDARLDSHSPGCVDPATLAAFVDGMLDEVSRGRVVSHIASCPDCYELVAEVVLTESELEEPRASDQAVRTAEIGDRPAKTFSWPKPLTLAAAGGLFAVAASVLFLVIARETPLDSLVSIVGNQRLTEARPSGEFRYGPVRSPVRGPRELENLELRAEAARLRERAGRTGTPKDLHASGVAELLAGDTASSIQLLELGVQARPDDPAYRADLGAAYMTRFLEGGVPSDATTALGAFDKAISLNPSIKEAWFNKALLLERLGKPGDAVAAWSKYLELHDDAEWRAEAIRHRDAIQRQQGR
jgi:anti-sigma factor RsiW